MTTEQIRLVLEMSMYRFDLREMERDVFWFILDGLSHEEIGQRLSITKKTVAFHATRIYKKLGIDGKRELVKWVVDQITKSEVLSIANKNPHDSYCGCNK